MADPETDDHVKLSLNLIQQAKGEHESLLRQLHQSRRTIDRSRKIIAILEQIIVEAEKK
jgi:hypothetical protein